MNSIAEAQDLIGALNSKRGALMERIAFNRNTRQALSLQAHFCDKKAIRQIADLHDEARRLSQDVETIDAALLEATKKHDAARLAQDTENKRGQARKWLTLADELMAIGADLDIGLTNEKLKLLANCVRAINAADLVFTSYAAYDLQVSAAIRVLLRDTIFAKRFEAVPPTQWRTFADLTSGWALTIRKRAAAVLGSDMNKVAA
jgi:hypothetical protein